MTTETEDLSGVSADSLRHVGLLMREAREKAGYTVERAAMSTRISRVFIEALEQEKFEVLPGAIFARGFIRNLCRAYGCDHELMIHAFEQAVAQNSHSESTQPFREPRQEIRVKEALSVIGGLAWTSRMKESVGNYYSKGKPFLLAAPLVALGIYGTYSLYNREEPEILPAAENAEAIFAEEPASAPAVVQESNTASAPAAPLQNTPADSIVVGEGVEAVEILVKEAVNVGITRDRDRLRSESLLPNSYKFQFNEQLRLYVENMDAVEIRFKGQPITGSGLKGEKRFMTFAISDAAIAKGTEKPKL